MTPAKETAMSDDTNFERDDSMSHPTIETALDLAFERARSAEEDSGAFYDALFATTVFMPIRNAYNEAGESSDTEAQSIEPLVWEVEGDETLLLFDTEERLARWATEPMNYVGIPGSTFFKMFQGELQVAVNLTVAPSSVMIPVDVVSWLHDRAEAMVETEEVPAGTGMDVTAPPELAPEAVGRITAKLAGLRNEIHEAIIFSLAIDAGEEESIRRVVLGVALTVGGIEDADIIATSLAETATIAFNGERAFEVALLDPESPLMNAARNVGVKLPIVDLSSLH